MALVEYDVADGIATLTLNRPERLNAWTNALGTEYFDRLADASADPDVRVVIVTGAGRGFCAGADLDMLQGISAGEGDVADPRPMTFPLSVPKLVIAAINGSCAGLGLVHTLMADLRFAAAGAKFTTAFSRRGLVAEHGSSWLLPRLVGQSNAMDLLFSGRVFLAEEAAELGMVNKVLPPDELLPFARTYAADVAANCSLSAIQTMKSQVYAAYETDLETARNEANRLMAESFAKPDFKEGVTSFVEKRPPAFPPLSVKL